MTRSGLLQICSCDHLKHYSSQGSVDGSIYRNCQKMLNSKLGFSRLHKSAIYQKSLCQTNKEGGAKVS